MVNSAGNDVVVVGVTGAIGVGLKTAGALSALGALLRAVGTEMALSLGQLTSMTTKSRRTSAPPANDLGNQRSASTCCTVWRRRSASRFILTAACISIATSVSTRWSRYA